MRLRQVAASKVVRAAAFACLGLASTAVFAQVSDSQGDFQVIPEPETLALLAAGVAAWAMVRWRNRK